jgi:hypothetical protein
MTEAEHLKWAVDQAKKYVATEIIATQAKRHHYSFYEGRKAASNGCGVEANPYFDADGNIPNGHLVQAEEWKSGWQEYRTAGNPTNRDAMRALQTLHLYYSKPAMTVPAAMHAMLGKSFVDAIATDPFKD